MTIRTVRELIDALEDYPDNHPIRTIEEDEVEYYAIELVDDGDALTVSCDRQAPWEEGS